MAVLQMQKLRLFVHVRDASEALRAVQKLGVVEFIPVDTTNLSVTQRQKQAFEFNYVSSRLDFAVQFLSRYETPVGGLRRIIEGERVQITGTEVYLTANEYHYNDAIDAAQRIEERLAQAHTKLGMLRDEKTLLTPWLLLDRTLGDPRETRTTLTQHLSGEVEAFATLYASLEQANILYHETKADDCHRVLTYERSGKATVEELCKTAGITDVELPMRRGTPREELARIDRAIQTELDAIQQAETEARTLSNQLPKLKVVADYIHWQKEKHDLLSETVMTKNILVFDGWCPISMRALLEDRISAKTANFAIEELPQVENELPPVEIENHPLVRPFEAITRLYGLPGHTDLDPTVFLASFFIVFFGLCLTDFGYGLFLAALTGFMLYRYNVPADLKRMLTLIMYGGFVTMLAGLLFGGYLGIDMEVLPKWMQTLQQFDPIKNPIPVFYLALALGMIQILVGLVLSIVAAAKNGRVSYGLWDKGPWIGAFIFGLLAGGTKAGLVPGASSLYLYPLYACISLIVLVAAYREPIVIAKPFKGILALYDIIGYFSDLLSYSRLLALGLSTSALAFAINLIAGMLREVPYVGMVLMAAVFIGGHIFSIVVNLLGAFIHSARLQFVEFFSKFLGDSGRPFKPFKRDERYVVIQDAS